MADRFGELGEADPLGFGFGPTNVEFRRVRLALEVHEPDRAVRIAEGLLSGLLTRTRRESPAGRELRRMAYRAGLPG